MQFEFPPLLVTCDSCGKSAETYNGADPDSAVECECCPVQHNHGGLGCRTVTISATARLKLFDVNDLMEAMGETSLPEREVVVFRS